MIAIIGGSGFYHADFLQNPKQDKLFTPFGEVAYTTGSIGGVAVCFLSRHGSGHAVPPHLVNYRANIWALKKLGVEQIFATAAVGSLNKAVQPGDFVVVDDFLDFTSGRIQTFFEGGANGQLLHMDVSEPYCSRLRNILIDNIRKNDQPLHEYGVYVCTNGPRYESPAEVKFFGGIGGSVVGMTGLPECILAREAEICYATVCMVTNYGTGLADHLLTFEEVREMMQAKNLLLQKIIKEAIQDASAVGRNCQCHRAAYEVGGFVIK